MQTIASLIPKAVLVSHILLIVLFLAILARESWGKGIADFLGQKAVLLGFLIALSAIVGSLFYSEIIGYEACSLCWWQRVLIYPQIVIFGMALWKRNKSSFLYAVPLTIIALVIALYQIASVDLGWGSLLSCTALEGSCAKIYFREFGYITIPVMSLTLALYVLLVAWAHKLFQRND